MHRIYLCFRSRASGARTRLAGAPLAMEKIFGSAERPEFVKSPCCLLPTKADRSFLFQPLKLGVLTGGSNNDVGRNQPNIRNLLSCAKVRWGSASHLYQSCVSGSALLDQETVEIVGPNEVLTWGLQTSIVATKIRQHRRIRASGKVVFAKCGQRFLVHVS